MKLKKIELHPKSCYISNETYLVSNYYDEVSLQIETNATDSIVYVFDWFTINQIIEETISENLLCN